MSIIYRTAHAILAAEIVNTVSHNSEHFLLISAEEGVFALMTLRVILFFFDEGQRTSPASRFSALCNITDTDQRTIGPDVQ